MTGPQRRIYNDFCQRRAAHYYPRKKMISINGFPAIPLKAAVAKMTEIMARDIVKESEK